MRRRKAVSLSLRSPLMNSPRWNLSWRAGQSPSTRLATSWPNRSFGTAPVVGTIGTLQARNLPNSLARISEKRDSVGRTVFPPVWPTTCAHTAIIIGIVFCYAFSDGANWSADKIVKNQWLIVPSSPSANRASAAAALILDGAARATSTCAAWPASVGASTSAAGRMP